jgi:hypothetical protein
MRMSDSQREAALCSLSANDQELLRPLRRAKALEELATGRRGPATPHQTHFAKAMRGEVETSTAYEEAFLRYRAALFYQYQLARKSEVSSVPEPHGTLKRSEREDERRRKHQAEKQRKRREADQAYAFQRDQLLKEDRLRTKEAQFKPTERNVENRYGIPEFEEGAPRPGWRPLGRFDRND